MKNILLVVENEKNAKFMLEKAMKFSPEHIKILYFNDLNCGDSYGSLTATVNDIVEKQCKTQLISGTENTTKEKVQRLEEILSDSDFAMVMLHRPILGKEQPDYSLIKAILRSSTNSAVFLCGDMHWKHGITILGTVDILDDSSEQKSLNKRVLLVASNIAEQLTAELSVLSIIPISVVSTELDIVEPSEVLSKKGKATKAQLEAFINEAGSTINISTHIAAGSPSSEIPAVVKTLKASLVVLGNVGRTGIKGFIVGNTAERILDRLTVDALIVKQDVSLML